MVNYLPLLVFLFAEVRLFEFEDFGFETTAPASFDAAAFGFISLPNPATFAPASTAPTIAPLAAPFKTSVKTSVA